MPTYQYECAACGHQFEAFQSMTENRLKKCPECSKNKLDRLIGTGTGMIFKGSGFYANDYKKKESTKKDSTKAIPQASPCKGSCSCHPKAS